MHGIFELLDIKTVKYYQRKSNREIFYNSWRLVETIPNFRIDLNLSTEKRYIKKFKEARWFRDQHKTSNQLLVQEF